MILYFMDRTLKVVGTASTELTGTYIVSSDSKTEDVDTGSSTFECDIIFSPDDRLSVEEIVAVGNIVMRYDSNDISRTAESSLKPEELVSTRRTINGFHDVFTIIETTVDTQDSSINFYAEDGGLDLLNDIAYAYSGSNQPYSTYVKQALTRTDFTLRDAVATSDAKTLTLEFKQADNVLARLQDIASSFEYEFSFGFDILGMEIVERWVEFTKERGVDTKKVIATDREINSIQIKKTIDKLATALYPTGSDSLTLAGYEYDDGNYFVSDVYLMSRDALSKWRRNDGGHIYRTYSSEATDQKALFEDALKELKKRVEPEVEYTIDLAYLPDGVHVGDRINVVDDEGELYLSGRVLKLVTSITSDTRTVTFGEWLIKTSGISEKVQELAAAFKNIADNRTFYTWFAYADDASGTNISFDSAGKTYMGIAANKLDPQPEDISKVAATDFKWTVIDEPDTLGNISISISSSEGTIFYRTHIQTTLTAHVYYNKVELTINDISDLLDSDLVWYKDGSTDPIATNVISIAVNGTATSENYICRLELKNG